MQYQYNSTCFSGDASCIIKAEKAARGEVEDCNQVISSETFNT